MNPDLRLAVRRRADLCCEYCRLPEAYAFITPFQVEDIIARQHHGLTILSNLALACDRCNLHKGPNLSGIDPVSRKVVRLFHPGRMKWSRHFRWDGPSIVGLTSVGRATIAALQLNHDERLKVRANLIEEGLFPP